MYLPQVRYQYIITTVVTKYQMFTSLRRMFDYYLHFTDFEDIFANMLCCINICFAWDLLLKSKKENHILLLNIIFYGKTVFTSATCNW